MLGRRTGCCGDPRNIPRYTRSPFQGISSGKKAGRNADGCSQGFLYRVQPGDTVWSLSRDYGVSWRKIMEANPNISLSGCPKTGKVICIPTDDIPICPDGVLHRMESGQTLEDVAVEYGLTLGDLKAANPRLSEREPAAGEAICVPMWQER